MTQPQSSHSSAAFFRALIDYAGLFPPAGLALEEAVKNYRGYLDHPKRWVLSRFIVTPAQLGRMTPDLANLFSSQQKLDISLVCKNPRAEIPAALDKIREFKGLLSLGSVEVPLAPSNDSAAQIAECEKTLQEIDALEGSCSAFFELPFFEGWETALSSACDAITQAHTQSDRLRGLKLRCGGTEPQLIPTPSRVALAITACAERKLPIKFTAGLHHPFQSGMQAQLTACSAQSMHGYFNVFFSTLAAFTRGLSCAAITELLTSPGSPSPQFSDAALEWHDIRLSTTEISALRRSKIISFGSCSFTEPIDDAIALTWL